MPILLSMRPTVALTRSSMLLGWFIEDGAQEKDRTRRNGFRHQPQMTAEAVFPHCQYKGATLFEGTSAALDQVIRIA